MSRGDDALWAVMMPATGGPICYGPFEEHDLAQRFARFVSEEIDPAKVVPFTEAGPSRALTWRSPLVELLNWRDNTQGNDRVPPGMRCPHRDFDDPTHCPCPEARR